MKKVLLVFAAATLLAVPVILNSCEEDSPLSCTKLLSDITSAALDYSSDQSSSNCNDYKDAIEEYLDANCDAAADSYQTILDGLNCN